MDRSAAGVPGLLLALLLLGLYSYPQHPFLLPDLAAEGGYDYFYFYASTKALDAGVSDIYLSDEMARFTQELSGGRWSIHGNHPLPFYLLYLGFAQVPFGSGYLVHLWLGVALFGLGLLALCLGLFRSRPLAIAVAGLLTAISLVTGAGVDNLWLGQVGFLLTFALCMAFVLAEAGWEIPAGAFLALAILLKIFPALLLLYFLRRGRWRVAAAALATLAVSGLAAGALWGFHHYAHFLEWSARTGYRSVVSNQSLMGALAAALPQGLLKPLNLLLTGAAVAGLWLAGRRWGGPSRENALLEFSAWLLAAMILAPLSWGHHHLALVMLLVAFAGLAAKREVALAGVALLCLYFLLEGEVVGRPWVKALHFHYYSWRLGLLMLLLLLGAALAGMRVSASFDAEAPSSRG